MTRPRTPVIPTSLAPVVVAELGDAPPSEPLQVWVDEPGATAPTGAIAITPAEAQAWLDGATPAHVRARRLDGIAVAWPTDAAAATRRVARSLRDKLAPRTAAGLRELASAWSHAPLLDALQRMPATHAPTLAELARALPKNDAESRHTARLLWALEHL